MTRTDWTIKEIEQMTADQAESMALSKENIKGFDVYFVDFGGYFGYSCLVFKDNHHIVYAGDYELHHRHDVEAGRDLKEVYTKRLNDILFTEEEIAETPKTYKEFLNKQYFLNNYYGDLEDHISMFDVDKKEEYEKNKENLIYNKVSFGYYYNAEFVKHHKELWKKLIEANKTNEDNFEYMKSAFLYEMFNHEYGISWQGNWDVLSCFGNIEYTDSSNDLENYFEQLGFNDVKKRAFAAAQKEYYKATENW